jgi:hypothetical protein
MKECKSSKGQLKSAELESAASEFLLEQKDDDSSEIIEESSRPEKKFEEKEKTKRFRSKRHVFKYQMKSIRVNRFKIFVQLSLKN